MRAAIVAELPECMILALSLAEISWMPPGTWFVHRLNEFRRPDPVVGPVSLNSAEL